MDTIINVLIPVEKGYDTVDVQIGDNAIAAISPGIDAIATPINGKNKLLLPGFINAHTHS